MMNVVIVTGTAPHHRHLCSALYRDFKVVGIIHPTERLIHRSKRVHQIMRYASSNGWPLTLLYLLGKAKRKPHGNGLNTDHNVDCTVYDDLIPPSLIHWGCDVRTPVACELLHSLKPDVTVCLGGPVYPEPFINGCNLMLNFHSGISPIYNGTASIDFAFANGHPHLCGGTLMVMSSRIDGGQILGHYLPEVRAGDSPDSLFNKTVQGAALMYSRLLSRLEHDKSPLQRIQQTTPLFYTKGFDFGMFHTEMIRKHLRNDLAAKHSRSECRVEYWRQSTPQAARSLYLKTIVQLLWSESMTHTELPGLQLGAMQEEPGSASTGSVY